MLDLLVAAGLSKAGTKAGIVGQSLENKGKHEHERQLERGLSG
jgi:hypothetical protein